MEKHSITMTNIQNEKRINNKEKHAANKIKHKWNSKNKSTWTFWERNPRNKHGNAVTICIYFLFFYLHNWLGPSVHVNIYSNETLHQKYVWSKYM